MQQDAQGSTATACLYPTSRSREQILTPAVPPLFSADQSPVERLPKHAWPLHRSAWRGPASSPSRPGKLNPVPLLTTPSAHSPVPRDADGGGRAQPHLRGCPYKQAEAEPRAGKLAPGSTAAGVLGEPACGGGQQAGLAWRLSAAGIPRHPGGQLCLPPGSCPELQAAPDLVRLAGVKGDVYSQISCLLYAGCANQTTPSNASLGEGRPQGLGGG